MAEFRPRALLTHLVTYGVDFVVIGGIAGTLHGSSRDTFDLDICPAMDDANLEVLGRALVELGARLRGVEEDVAFVPDERTLHGMEVLTLDTSFGALDVLMRPDGCPPYDRLRRRATRMDLGTVAVAVASIEDLLEMKRASDRIKDRADVEELEAVQRLERRLSRSRR
jgi:hypothetical protein